MRFRVRNAKLKVLCQSRLNPVDAANKSLAKIFYSTAKPTDLNSRDLTVVS